MDNLDEGLKRIEERLTPLKGYETRLGKEINKLAKSLPEKKAFKIPQGMNLPQIQMYFNEVLRQIIRPRDQSDRTSFRKISNWLVRGINEGKFSSEIFDVVLGYAREANKPECRNPAAVFTTILKKELGYKV